MKKNKKKNWSLGRGKQRCRDPEGDRPVEEPQESLQVGEQGERRLLGSASQGRALNSVFCQLGIPGGAEACSDLGLRASHRTTGLWNVMGRRAYRDHLHALPPPHSLISKDRRPSGLSCPQSPSTLITHQPAPHSQERRGRC